VFKRIRKHLSRRRASALPLEALLEKAGVPRSVSPELLEVARLAGLRMEEPPDPKPDPDPAPDPNPDPAPDPKPDPDPAPTPDPPPAGQKLIDEGEFHRLQRIAAEKAEGDRKRKREEDEAAGRHAEVVESVEQERETERTAREEVEASKSELELSITVRDVATRLGFIDPADARLHLPDGTPNDPKEVERALKKVAEEKKYLTGGQGSRTGAPGGGADPSQEPDIDEQIREAETNGDTATSIRLKRAKAAKQQAQNRA
jgi:colicin import membrane protein